MVWDSLTQQLIPIPRPKPTRSYKFLKGVATLLLALASFVAGAIAPVPSFLVNNLVVRPVAEAVGGTPLGTESELATACDDPSVPLSGVVATDPSTRVDSWVDQYSPKRQPIPDSGAAIYKQGTVYISLRPQWKDPIVVERLHAKITKLDVQSYWIARPSGGCGGGDTVGSRVYRLNTDAGSTISPDYENSRGLAKKDYGPKFVILPDAALDIEIDVRACDQSTQVQVLIDYRVRGVWYRDQLAAKFAVAVGDPKSQISYDSSGYPKDLKRLTAFSDDTCSTPFARVKEH